jgi:malate dehydrogenase (oxaloacetate-decarboxylating)(NADP+)
MDSGVARKPIADLRRYGRELSGRLDMTASALDSIFESVRDNPRRVVFAEGEEEKIVRAAIAFHKEGYGSPILIGREDRVARTLAGLGITMPAGIEIHNARVSAHNDRYAASLYARLQRDGFLQRDAQRMVNQDRNVFAAAMVAAGDADAMVTGLTRSRSVCLEAIAMAIDPLPGRTPFGITLMLGARETIFISDTLIHERPTPEELADIAEGSAAYARRLGHEPRVALLSHSTFGQPMHATVHGIREAVAILESRDVDFEFDGDMSPDVALEPTIRALYPFCRLTGNANVLSCPACTRRTSPPALHRVLAAVRPSGRCCWEWNTLCSCWRWMPASAESWIWRRSRRIRRLFWGRGARELSNTIFRQNSRSPRPSRTDKSQVQSPFPRPQFSPG